MIFPAPPKGPYELFLRQMLDILSQADDQNRKHKQNLELGGPERLILHDEDTGDRYRLKLASGVLTVEAL